MMKLLPYGFLAFVAIAGYQWLAKTTPMTGLIVGLIIGFTSTVLFYKHRVCKGCSVRRPIVIREPRPKPIEQAIPLPPPPKPTADDLTRDLYKGLKNMGYTRSEIANAIAYIPVDKPIAEQFQMALAYFDHRNEE